MANFIAKTVYATYLAMQRSLAYDARMLGEFFVNSEGDAQLCWQHSRQSGTATSGFSAR